MSDKKTDIWFTAVLCLAAIQFIGIGMVLFTQESLLKMFDHFSEGSVCMLSSWVLISPLIIIGIWEKIKK